MEASSLNLRSLCSSSSVPSSVAPSLGSMPGDSGQASIGPPDAVLQPSVLQPVLPHRVCASKSGRRPRLPSPGVRQHGPSGVARAAASCEAGAEASCEAGWTAASWARSAPKGSELWRGSAGACGRGGRLPGQAGNGLPLGRSGSLCSCFSATSSADMASNLASSNETLYPKCPSAFVTTLKRRFARCQ